MFKDVLKKVGLFLLTSTVLGAATLGTLHYTQIADITPVLDFMTLKGSELMTMGFSGSAATIGILAYKTWTTSSVMQIKEEFNKVSNELRAEMNLIQEQNAKIVAKQELDAQVKIEGRVLTESQKAQYIKWLGEQAPTLAKAFLDIIPDELEEKAKDVVLSKAKDIMQNINIKEIL